MQKQKQTNKTRQVQLTYFDECCWIQTQSEIRKEIRAFLPQISAGGPDGTCCSSSRYQHISELNRDGVWVMAANKLNLCWLAHLPHRAQRR